MEEEVAFTQHWLAKMYEGGWAGLSCLSSSAAAGRRSSSS